MSDGRFPWEMPSCGDFGAGDSSPEHQGCHDKVHSGSQLLMGDMSDSVPSLHVYLPGALSLACSRLSLRDRAASLGPQCVLCPALLTSSNLPRCWEASISLILQRSRPYLRGHQAKVTPLDVVTTGVGIHRVIFLLLPTTSL